MAWHKYRFESGVFGHQTLVLARSTRGFSSWFRSVITLFATAHLSIQAAAIVGWGDNYYGQLNTPPNLTNVVGVAAGYIHSLALTADGRVIGWGNSDHGQASPPPDLTNAVAIRAMNYSSVALRADGTVVAWGSNIVGETNVPTDLSNVAAIAAGGDHGLALLSNGTVRAWGYNRNGQADVPAGLTNVKSVAAGGNSSIALKQDGTVLIWGDSGMLTNLNNELNVVAATAIDCCVLLVRADGTLITAGLSPFFQIWFRTEEFIGPGVLEADGSQTATLFRFNSGKVLGLSGAQVGMPQIIDRVIAIAAGGMHSLVLVHPHLIQAQPLSRVVVEGSPVGFTVSATSNVELSHQWRFKDVEIPGATNPVLNIASATFGDAGGYAVVVRDRYGSANSSNAQLTVVSPITNQTVLAGRAVSFAPTLAGTNALSFQWTLNGTPVPGGNAAMLVVSNAQAQHAGAYTLRVQHISGAATNVSADLTVLPAPPSIVTAPNDQTMPAGTNVSLRVVAIGNEPFAYQWQFDGTDIPAATNAQLDLLDVQSEATGTYNVRITNSEGEAQTSATLTVQYSAPWINVHPATQRVPEGMEFRFSVKAAGSRILRYQWYYSGTPIAGRTDAYFFINATRASDSGHYFVVVTNAYGSVTSSVAQLTVRPALGPVTSFAFLPGPASCSELIYNGSTNLMQIDGGCPWGWIGLRPNGTVLEWDCQRSATPQRASIPADMTNIVAIDGAFGGGIALARNGRVRCWGPDVDCPGAISNIVAVAAAAGCKLALRSDGTVVSWGNCGPAGFVDSLRNVVSISGGLNHFLALRSDGTVVGWPLNFYGNDLGEATVPPLSNAVAIAAGLDGSAAVTADGRVVTWGLAPAAPSDLTNAVDVSVGTDHVTALKADGMVRKWALYNLHSPPPHWLKGVVAIHSDCETSFVLTKYPVFLSEPTNTSAVVGSNAVFRVQAAGHGPLRYQWYHESAPVTGATNSTLRITSVQAQHRGNYTVEVFNPKGSIVSAPAQLVVSPTFVQHPKSIIATVGRNVTFSAAVAGTDPFTYTWYKSNTLVATTAAPQFTISNVQPKHAGLFSVRAQNTVGVARSKTAVLSVVPQIIAVRKNAKMRVSWPSWTNAVLVEWCPDLVTQAWRPITVNIVSNSFAVPISTTQGFYRLIPASAPKP